MRELKRQINLRWDELLLIPVFETIFFLFGEVILYCFIRFEGKNEALDLGTLITITTSSIFLIFFGCSVMSSCFNTSISMGSIRRRLIPAHYIISFLECICAAAYAYLLHHLELWILHTFYGSFKIETITGMIFQFKYILPGALVIVAINSLFGTLFLKFGKISLVIMWVLWIFAFTAVPRLISSIGRYQHTIWGKAILNFIQSITESKVIFSISACSVIIMFIAWLMLRRQQVRL